MPLLRQEIHLGRGRGRALIESAGFLESPYRDLDFDRPQIIHVSKKRARNSGLAQRMPISTRELECRAGPKFM